VLTRAFSTAASLNTVAAWTELLMLSKTVLCAPPRTGKRHRKQAAAFTLDRLSRWQSGERRALWDDAPESAHTSRSENNPEANRRRAEALTREGYDRKACAALVSDGLLEASPETLLELKKLHPQSAPTPASSAGLLPAAPTFCTNLVAKTVNTFPEDSAPGPSGARAQHLKDALTPADKGPVLEALTPLTQLLANGCAPREVAPFLAGAGLVALPKAKGGVRPIAVGELLRRLTAKLLCAEVKDEAHSYTFPAQVGVATPLGAETAVHVVRQWMERQEGSNTKAALKLDFRNAFNLVDRSAMLHEVDAHFPTLSRWVRWCYEEESSLLFAGHELLSATGVQQGDPLGPLLFATTIQPLVEELKAGTGEAALDLTLFYHDDGFLAGDLEALSAALRRVEEAGARLGLQLNLGKCELLLPKDNTLDPTAPARLFPRELLEDDEGNSTVRHNGNFDLLGCPVGSPEHCANYTAQVAAKAGVLLDEVGSLADPQVVLRLLRVCASHAKLTYNCRGTPSDAHLAELSTFDSKVRETFAKTTGLLVNDKAWKQATLGFRNAGLGLRSTARHAAAAYLASAAGSRKLCSQVDPAFCFDLEDACAAPSRAAAALNAELPDGQKLTTRDVLRSQQKKLSQALDSTSFEELLGASSLAERATLLSESQPGARDFLSAVPNRHLRLTLEPA